jgi:hypothetical protein
MAVAASTTMFRYLLHELHGLLGLEDDPRWMNADGSGVPFWGELIS